MRPALLLLSSSLVACASPPLAVTPLPPHPPACPADGCAAAGAPGSTAGASPRARDVCPGAGEAPCGGASPSDCRERALSAWSDASDDRAVACVARRLAEACSLGDAQACAYAGRMWLDGRAVARDEARGMKLLASACDGGVALACMDAVRWLADGDHASAIPDGVELRARLDAEHGCLTGSAEECFHVGFALYMGRDGFPRDRARAIEVYARGCDLGPSSPGDRSGASSAGAACNNLADALAYGQGVGRDVERAAATFAKACRLGEALGCANYGYMLEHGEGVARDAARAHTLYRDACSGGDVYGCLHAEMMDASDGASPRGAPQELARWQRACAARDARACAFVGVVYEDGPDGFARDEAKSLQAMQRACDLGHRLACDWMKVHPTP